MATENLLVLLLYTGCVGVGVACLYRYRRSNPVFWFLPLQWVIGAGTIAIIELDRPSDLAYVMLLFTAVLAFLCGAFVAFWSLRVSIAYRAFWMRPVEGDRRIVRVVVIFLVILSVVVTAIYYHAVGYNLLVDLALGRKIADITSARLATYSGEHYYAPGYVNQFKNVLLPLGLSVMGAWAWRAGNRWGQRVLLLVGPPLALWALLGTGQRGFLVYAFCAFLFGLAAIVRIRVRKMLPVVTLVAVLFGVVSFQLGRIHELSVGSVLIQILARMFQGEEEGNLVGFRYVFRMDTSWFSEWARGFKGVLPGTPGSDLDNQIFALIHGSTRGTAALSTVGSVFYNGGIIGVLGVYLAMGWTYTYFYRRFLRGRRTILRCFTYGAAFFYLAFFVTGSPAGLINRGLVTLGIVLFIRKLLIALAPRAERRIPQMPPANPSYLGVVLPRSDHSHNSGRKRLHA